MIAARRDTKFSRNDGKLGWRDLCLRQWWGLWSCLRESDRLQGCNQMLYLEMTGQRKQSLYQERVGDARIAWHRCCQWQGGFAVWDSLNLARHDQIPIAFRRLYWRTASAFHICQLLGCLWLHHRRMMPWYAMEKYVTWWYLMYLDVTCGTMRNVCPFWPLIWVAEFVLALDLDSSTA